MTNHPRYDVQMRDNLTGEERLVPMEMEWHDSSLFWWTDGNFGCDCNRGIVFAGDDDAADDVPCGDTRFTAIKAIFPDDSEQEIDDEVKP